MEINRVFTKLNLSKINKNNSTKKTEKINEDKIALSGEVKKLAEQKKYVDIVKKVPDVRWDKVNELKKQIKSGSYFENIDLDDVADKLLNS